MKYALILCFILLFFNHQANSWPVISEKETTRITHVEAMSISTQILYNSNIQLQKITSLKSLIADFTSDAVEICPKEHIQFIDTSIGEVIEWEWYFESGIPSSSAEQNPIVYFPDDGTFDVSLIVFDGISADTMYVENYIYVIELPEITFSVLPEFCLDDPVYDLVEGSPAGGEYSGPGVFFGKFVPAIADIGTHILSYYYMDENGCGDTANQEAIVSACTGIYDNPNDFQLNIVPNPATNYCWVNLKQTDVNNLKIEIIDHIGKIVNSLSPHNLQFLGNKRKINIGSLKPGLYFIRIVKHDKILAINKLIVY